MIPRVEKYRTGLSPWELYRGIFQDARESFFLDSIDYQGSDQRYSYIGANPAATLTLANGRLRWQGEVSGQAPAGELSRVLRRLLGRERLRRTGGTPQGPDFFTGGAVGFWGYELARWFEKIRFRVKPGPATPDLYLGLFREMVIYDHKLKRYHLALWPRKGDGRFEMAEFRARLACAEKRMRDSGARGFSIRNFRPEMTRSRFEAMVRRAKAYIAAGDIYQANLSQRFCFDFEGSSLKLYDALRTANPSPFCSFLNFGGLQVISSSPERLVRKRARLCETKPIAGTRGYRPGHDLKALEKELLAHPKERAEHIMLVDLERNDLGRVCDWRSVQVKEMMKIERYARVIHLVSKITGRLSRGRDALDLLAAVFPGGTITGCPKVRCMQVIDELEPVRRGLYTGSIGYLDFKGDMDLNIVIRTLILEKNKGYLQVGAGIVHDSDPAREYEETLHKAEALAEALAKASA